MVRRLQIRTKRQGEAGGGVRLLPWREGVRCCHSRNVCQNGSEYQRQAVTVVTDSGDGGASGDSGDEVSGDEAAW